MPRKKLKDDPVKIADLVVKTAQDKKGKDILLLDLRKIPNSISDFFVICHGTNRVQVEAIMKAIEEAVFKKAGIHAWHKEGVQNAEWILLDYVDVVVHIFQQNQRIFYHLEDLWGDAKITKYPGIE